MADVGTNIILGVIGKLLELHQNHNSNVTQVKRDKFTGRNRTSGAAGEVTGPICCKMERKTTSTVANTGPPVETITNNLTQRESARCRMVFKDFKTYTESMAAVFAWGGRFVPDTTLKEGACLILFSILV